MRTRLSLLFCAGLLASALPARSQFYVQRNLVSDGAVATEQPPDPHLVNAWGLVSSATSPWWVANNGSATATLYDGAGVRRPIVVSIPGSPTGIVFNGGTGFVVKSGSASGSARFIFATEDGAIAGWNPAVPPPSTSMQAFIGVDASSRGAVYKGLAIDSATAGKFL